MQKSIHKDILFKMTVQGFIISNVSVMLNILAELIKGSRLELISPQTAKIHQEQHENFHMLINTYGFMIVEH